MSQSLRVAIVTGASRGLGGVVAHVLASRGYDLVVGAREARPLHDVSNSLRRLGGRVVSVEGDVTDPAVRTRLVQETRRLGGLGLLVNNASELGGTGPLSNVDLLRFERVLQVNVLAPLALVALALPLLTESQGLIVNLSSDAAHGAYPGWGAYGASKAALELLTRTLANELSGRGVSAVSVDPGDMRTRMHQEAFPGEDISDRPLPEVTVPFWNWLFDQDPRSVNGKGFAAQQRDGKDAGQWLQLA